MVAGSFDTNIYAFDGANGDILWANDTGESRVQTALGVPDVTGDAVPDVVAGTQTLIDVNGDRSFRDRPAVAIRL